MAKNANMISAKKAKNDEFFTQFDDIAKELCHKEYREAFRGKKIYCPFSSPLAPYFSQFYEFFKLNFQYLGIQSLLCTYLVPDGQKCMAYFINGDKNGDGVIDDADIEIHELEGNGDFFSDEIQSFVDWADVIVDNPPFSRFREIVDILMGKGKQFVIIGNKNAITYKEIFPYLKDNKMFLGYTSLGEFRLPDGSTSTNMTGLCKWFTNIPLDKHSRPMLFGKTYVGNEKDYPKYDNYDAINVDRVCDIPGDYMGVMGVPITFLNDYCPWQFKILGITDRENSSGLRTKVYTKDDSTSYNDLNRATAIQINGGGLKGTYARILITRTDRPYINGDRMYARILIQRIK